MKAGSTSDVENEGHLLRLNVERHQFEPKRRELGARATPQPTQLSFKEKAGEAAKQLACSIQSVLSHAGLPEEVHLALLQVSESAVAKVQEDRPRRTSLDILLRTQEGQVTREVWTFGYRQARKATGVCRPRHRGLKMIRMTRIMLMLLVTSSTATRLEAARVA